MAPEHILVPLDGSPLSEAALSHALETFDCRVTVLNVVAPLDSGMSEGGVLEAGPEREESAADRAERLVTRASDDASRAVDTVVETGDPADTILGFVEDHDIDHVVMGGHGGPGGGLTRRLLGTVATAVVGEAPVTVTVVR